MSLKEKVCNKNKRQSNEDREEIQEEKIIKTEITLKVKLQDIKRYLSVCGINAFSCMPEKR